MESDRAGKIASHLPRRNEGQFQERRRYHPYVNINKEAWTQDEELAVLRRLRTHHIYGNKSELTKFLPGRWSNHPHVNKNEEASTQVRTHQTCGNKSAEKICGLIALSPMNPWTAEEDEMLRMAVQRYKGKKFEMIGRGEINSVFFEMKNWTKIAECFKDRSDIECAQRWDKLLTLDLARSPWWREEDERMILLVKKYGQERWSTIAAYFPGRTEKQCRERWHNNHINPKINKQAWTQDEELALIRAQQIYGNNWAELTKFLPERTDNEIKNHWNSSVEKKLDMDMASGLLSQFAGLSIVSRPNHSAASSSPKAQQPSEDYSGGGVEVRSQGSKNIIA